MSRLHPLFPPIWTPFHCRFKQRAVFSSWLYATAQLIRLSAFANFARIAERDFYPYRLKISRKIQIPEIDQILQEMTVICFGTVYNTSHRNLDFWMSCRIIHVKIAFCVWLFWDGRKFQGILEHWWCCHASSYQHGLKSNWKSISN